MSFGGVRGQTLASSGDQTQRLMGPVGVWIHTHTHFMGNTSNICENFSFYSLAKQNMHLQKNSVKLIVAALREAPAS